MRKERSRVVSSPAPSPSASSPRAPVLEVFASIQGEGLYVGEPQVFLRLRGCPLRCRWCDTPGSWGVARGAEVRIDAQRGVRREASWATPFQAACWIAEVEPGGPRSVSVTGGEPLLWPEFVIALRGMLGARRLHLETAGAHPRALARVALAVDHVSLDLKCAADLDAPVELAEFADDDASASPTSERAPREARERAPRDADEWRAARAACLQLVGGRDACAKVIVSGERRAEDFTELLDDVERLAPNLLVVVQPATALRGVPAPDLALVGAVAEMARDRDLAVRILPQLHRLIGVP